MSERIRARFEAGVCGDVSFREGLEGIPVYNDLADFVNQLLGGAVK